MKEEIPAKPGRRRLGGILATALVALLASLALPAGAAALPATHFMVTAPPTATAGSPFTFTVTAQDVNNATDTTYAGTVHFTSTDGAATLPANSMLSSGVGTFTNGATLRTAGIRTISATDTVLPVTGTSGPITVSGAAATHLAVSAPPSATASSAFNFTVTALDQFNNTATSYAGTVGFTSTDGSATLPANSPLTMGTGTFSATLRTAGNQTITANDGSISGTSNAIAVSTATHFTVAGPTTAVAGSAFTFTVTALNPNSTVDTAYGGTVRFSSSDGSASLPLDSKLTNGTGTFSTTLRTTGSMTITANETGNPSVAGTSGPIAVSPSNAFSFGKLRRNTQNGTATLTVDVPGPGKLTLGGKGIQPQRPIASSLGARARAVSGAGAVKLTVKATGKAKKKLRKTGKAKVKVKVTFTPTGGSAASKSETVKLKKVLHG
jgi:hypothetical protein